MIVLHGIDRFGQVDEVDGEYLVTCFRHVLLLPLWPLGSEWVTRRDGKLLGRACRLSGKSVLHAYVRAWGIVGMGASALAALAGREPMLVLTAILAVSVAASFAERRMRDPRELRRVALQRPVLGTALAPSRIPRDTAVALLPLAQARFDAVSGGRSAFDVAQRGAASSAQAAHASVLLDLHVAAARDRRSTAALAASQRLLDRPLAADGDGDPFRTPAPTSTAAGPLLEPYELTPTRWHFVGATILTYAGFLAFCLHALSSTEPQLLRADLATRNQARELAYEVFPKWRARFPAPRCPTLLELVEYGGVDIDAFEEPFHLRCDGIPPDAGGIGVWSSGANRVNEWGAGDDVTSWEQP